MVSVYGVDAPSYSKVKFWSKQFKWGRDSIQDDPRSGRPIEARTEENVQAVEELVLKDRRIKVAERRE